MLMLFVQMISEYVINGRLNLVQMNMNAFNVYRNYLNISLEQKSVSSVLSTPMPGMNQHCAINGFYPYTSNMNIQKKIMQKNL